MNEKLRQVKISQDAFDKLEELLVNVYKASGDSSLPKTRKGIVEQYIEDEYNYIYKDGKKPVYSD
ncbi:TPA: hypothetical protein QC448_005641 [Bacillus cereus]|nr:hypothetical protein [Bacillus thuringiensis]MRB61524.1 hypothetical protein [Bacillus thuringiensis]HDR8494521.1 hypothetical protein [Bacillus cereus]